MSKSQDAFRTISEVAEELDLPQHVLRFWETRFKQIRPMKRGGGRRYYRPDDVELLKGIRHLLYGQGYTIKGVQRILKEQGNRFVASAAEGDVALLVGDDLAQAAPPDTPVKQAVPVVQVEKQAPAKSASETPDGQLQGVLAELLECKRMLDQAR